jgi:hypothetical protein
MVKWMAITFGIGMLLIVIEYYYAKKKKGGFTPTDRQRIIGIFWLAVLLSGLVGGIIWMSPD